MPREKVQLVDPNAQGPGYLPLLSSAHSNHCLLLVKRCVRRHTKFFVVALL